MDQELEMSSEFIEVSFSAPSTSVDVPASAERTDQDMMNHVDLDMYVSFEDNTQSPGSSNSVDVFGMSVSRDIFGSDSNGNYNKTTVCENEFLQVNRVVTVDASGVSPVEPSGSQASFPALTQGGEGPLTVSNSCVSRGHPAAQFPQRQQQQAVDQQSEHPELNKFEDKPVELQYIKQIKEEHPPTPQNIHKLGLQHNEKPGEYISSRHSNPNEVPRTSSSVNTSDASPALQLSKNSRNSHFNPYFRVTCTLCSISFSNQGLLKNHKKAHGANQRYKCSKCDCSYTKARNLDKHLLAHNASMPSNNIILSKQQDLPSTSAQPSIPVNKLTPSLSNTKVNFNRKTNKKLQNLVDKFTCLLCGISCKNKGNLIKHMKTHGANEKYMCNCDVVMETCLINHKLYHEPSMPSNNILLAQQQEEDVILSSTLTLQPSISSQSRSSVNTEETSVRDSKGHFKPCFTCSLCGISYSNEAYLTRHMKAHGGKRYR